MNSEARQAKINRANERRHRREEVSDTELPADNEDYSGMVIIILMVSILSGYFLYKWFMGTTVVASLNTVFASFIFISVLNLILFGLNSLFLRHHLLSSKRLAGVTYFGSAAGVIIGVLIAVLVK